MKTTLSSLGELVRDYKYDQLHRIREANSLGNAYKETFTYDANGNIKTNTLHNSEGNQVDNTTYHYFAQTNKLHYISDSYGETQAGFDLMNQTNGNFAYDLIGNLVKDKAMQVSSMSWTAYHKREKVVKEDGTTITYRYDAMNNRIYKKAEGNGVTETTHYLRDGTGNTLAIYKNGELEELNIYGSSRLGTYNGKTEEGKRTLGNKRYELSNHLGNALVVITDNKLGKDLDNDFIADTYIALVVSERDYLAFGAVMHKRSSENEDYTYSFNGKELDQSTGWQDYGFRDYNPVYKRFDSVDPMAADYAWNSTYCFAENSVIGGIDLEGRELAWMVDQIAETATKLGLKRTGGFISSYGHSLVDPMDPLYTTYKFVQAIMNGEYMSALKQLDVTGLSSLPDLKKKAEAAAAGDEVAQGELIGMIPSLIGARKAMLSTKAKSSNSSNITLNETVGAAKKGFTKRNTPSSSSLSKVKDVIKETKNGKGNLESKYTLTQSEALEAAQKWVGKDYIEVGNKGLYRSTKPNADGTYNQYRMDNGSLSGSHKPNVPHVHLEVIKIQKTKMKGVGGKEIILTDEKQIINNHIPIE